MLTENTAKVLEECRRSERKLVSLVTKVLEELLKNNISRKEAAETFLKIYVDPASKPEWLEEALATLILVDEEPGHGAPTIEELETILRKLKEKNT